MKCSTSMIIAAFSLGLLSASAQAGVPGRGLSSLPAPASQAEQMLMAVPSRSTAARSPASESSVAYSLPVRVVGACRTSYGAIYGSSEPGYTGCVEQTPTGSAYQNENAGALVVGPAYVR